MSTPTVNSDATEIRGGSGEVMIEVEAMDKPAFIERRKIRTQPTQGVLDAWLLASALGDRVNARWLRDHEPTRLLVQDGNRGRGVLRGHGGSATVSECAPC